MTDPVLAHRGPSDARWVISTNGDHFNAHDISESHDLTSCKWRAGPVRYRLNPCLRLVNRSRLRRSARQSADIDTFRRDNHAAETHTA
jgi:hypothetical protein